MTPVEQTSTPHPDLRAAAQWLVDIWADNVAIDQGSALWEDIQRLRAALFVTTADHHWRSHEQSRDGPASAV